MAEALFIVDPQLDFMPGGALPVPEGDRIVPVVNRYVEHFRKAGKPIFVSRDWHPEVTKHFQQYGGIWPPHCIQGTRGAEFHPELDLKDAVVISKGMDPERDSYSAFDGFEPDGTPLEEGLRRRGIERLYVAGLATDYCVRWTVLEALKRGFKVTVLLDAIRGVNLKPHDSEEAIEEMVRQGADVATLERLPAPAPA
jgi:nicotinamidase/pyrazinamidase